MKRLIFAMLLVSAVLLGRVAVYADSFMPPSPFEIWSEDETMVFRWEPSHGFLAQAGVYRGDELVYSVLNLPTTGISAENFFFSADMRHFAFRPTQGHTIALGFFEDGVVRRVYRIDELVRDMTSVRQSVTMSFWESREGRDFDAGNNALTFVTIDGITYVFDITTGETIYDTAGDAPFIPIPYPFGELEYPIWVRYPLEPFEIEPRPADIFIDPIIITPTRPGSFIELTEVTIMPKIDGSETISPWAMYSVVQALNLGLLPASFRSDFQAHTTRAEFAAIAIALYEQFNEPVTGRRTFADTDSESVEMAAYLRIVSGVGNNRFNPDAPLTREQAAVMLARLASVLGQPPISGQPDFADSMEISYWATLAVGAMQRLGIMSGVGSNRFAPLDPYTREQSIVTIVQLFDILNQ